MSTITFFAANNLKLALSGSFFSGTVSQTVDSNGTKTTRSRHWSLPVMLPLTLGDFVTFARKGNSMPHAAFPLPREAAVVMSVSTQHAKLAVSSDCTVQVTNLRNSISSRPEPLAHLYNRVSDNHTTNMEPCVSAQAVGSNGTVRITAAHSYGTLDLGITVGEGWLLFTILDLSGWHADPIQKHLRIATLCPRDMCPNRTNASPWESPITGAPFTGGRFVGFRGSEGEYPDSAGFFTISSQFQSFTTWMFAEAGQKLAYTLCPTTELPQIRAALRTAESIAPPSPNRARTWWWTSSNETLLDDTIATAHAMGVELLFMDGMLQNQGDFTADTTRWPSGLAAAGKRIKDAGLQVGLHMIPTGAQTCHGNPGCSELEYSNPGCSGCSRATVERPDVFVPQGLAPRDWYWAETVSHCWHLGCILPKSASNDRADRREHGTVTRWMAACAKIRPGATAAPARSSPAAPATSHR